jgi:hypothetical protein
MADADALELPLALGDPFTPSSDADFDVRRAQCLVPARSCVFGYIDDNGDLRIWSDDFRQQCTSEMRIDRDDIPEFIDGLLALVGAEPAQLVRSSSGSTAMSNAEKCRAYRRRKRHQATPSDTTSDTGDTR